MVGAETNYFGNAASFSYCLSSDAAPVGSEGCVVGRPVFTANDPLYLAKHTPGKGQGSVVGYEDRLLAATDFFGRPRVKFVSGKGVADIDIGATESKYYPKRFRISIRRWPVSFSAEAPSVALRHHQAHFHDGGPAVSHCMRDVCYFCISVETNGF